MKRFFFWQKNRHLGTENQKIQEKFARKVLKENPRVSNIPKLVLNKGDIILEPGYELV